MPTDKMHADEFPIDARLVKVLLSQQFPQWAELKLELIKPAGTDNAMYRLGADKVVRLPRMAASSANIEKEVAVLPRLGPHLPIAIPAPLGVGKPNADYPFPWMICSQLEGKHPGVENPIDEHSAAADLGHFVAAMQSIKGVDGPQCRRGNPLSDRDAEVRKSIKLSEPFFDTKLLTKLWDAALSVPKWDYDPVWIHGDLHAGNLLAENGKITAVVDFGASGVGDPAVDAMVAWSLLTQETREIFRAIVQPDAATWARARGWALSLGVVAYPYYVNSNPAFADIAKRALDQVLLDSQ